MTVTAWSLAAHAFSCCQHSIAGQPSNRCTEARLILNRLAIADWLRPVAESVRTSSAREATVGGRPCRLPRLRAWAIPAFTRSRRMSRSNSAKSASSPAIARPTGVVKSKASVKEISVAERLTKASGWYPWHREEGHDGDHQAVGAQWRRCPSGDRVRRPRPSRHRQRSVDGCIFVVCYPKRSAVEVGRGVSRSTPSA